jgi:hypothetical protein
MRTNEPQRRNETNLYFAIFHCLKISIKYWRNDIMKGSIVYFWVMSQVRGCINERLPSLRYFHPHPMWDAYGDFWLARNFAQSNYTAVVLITGCLYFLVKVHIPTQAMVAHLGEVCSCDNLTLASPIPGRYWRHAFRWDIVERYATSVSSSAECSHTVGLHSWIRQMWGCLRINLAL